MTYKMQGGVKNYLGNQKMVNAPLKWRSGPQHPSTELAYITQKEKDLLVKKDLHGSLKGGVHRGPSGIMSLNGWGSKDSSGKEVGMSGAATSAAETGSSNAADRREIAAHRSGPALPPGVVDKNTQDYRAAFINAGGGQRVNPGFFDSRSRLSPNERLLARTYRNNPNNRFAKRAYTKTHGGGGGILGFLRSGGLFGNLLRGVGQNFGWGKKWNEPTSNMSQGNTLSLYEPSTNPIYYDDSENEEILNVKDGGRIGYNRGRVVNPGGYRGDEEFEELEDENIYEFMQDQGVPYSEMAEGEDFLLREEYDKYLFEMEELDLVPMSFEDFKEQAMMAEGESDQGIASIV